MKYTYHGWVGYARREGARYVSGVSFGDDDKETTVAELARHVEYYETQLEAPATVYEAWIDQTCATCQGRGKISERRGVRVIRTVTKRCPDCKGKDSVKRVVTWVDRPFTPATGE